METEWESYIGRMLYRMVISKYAESAKKVLSGLAKRDAEKVLKKWLRAFLEGVPYIC